MKQCKKMMPFVTAGNRRCIKSCREAGIDALALQTANLEGHACATADALANTAFQIDDLPQLPLKGCDAQSCGCYWYAPLPEDINQEPKKETPAMNPPPIEETITEPKSSAPTVIGVVAVAFLCAMAGFLLWANFKTARSGPAEPSAVESFHANVPEAATLISQGERDGLMLLEPDNKRAYIAAGVWRAADAKRKEMLVNMLALECARRRGDQSIRLDVLDKHTGKALASLSQWDGLKIH